MKKITAGHGEPRYTLYIPLVMHRLSRPIDLQLLASELGKKLSVEDATIHGSNGWEQLRMGPFATEEMANEVFHRTIRYLVTLCVQAQYPIFFGQELMKVSVPDVLLTFGFDASIDAFVNLASAVVVPEHLQVYDQGVMLGHVDPQMRSQQLRDALDLTCDLPGPLLPKVRLAVEAYIAACATHTPMMKFVGFVICLETLCEQESRPPAEVAALKAIRTSLKKLDFATADTVHESMLQATLESISRIQKLSIGAQFQRLIVAHSTSIATHLEHGHPWINDMKEAAKSIYAMRSKIVHEGNWGVDHDSTWIAQNFAKVAAKAVLLDKLSKP